MAQVVFSPVEFKAQYPMFAGVDDAFLQGCFNQATLYLSNKDCSPVQDLDERKTLLYMLVAHIAYLMGALNPAGMNSMTPVGRLGSATEGSVSVSYDFGPMTNREAWYQQTQWGSMFWAATAYLRSFSYRPRPTQWR